MRWLDWLRGSRLSDDLDPTLTTLFAHRDAQEEVTPAQLARMRAAVDARLHHNAPSGHLVRRLGLAAVGGGSMWTLLVGAAAAHKVAAVTVGLGMVFGGSVAAEASGVGPAVRSAVTSTVQGDLGGPNVDLFARQTGDVEATATATATATAEVEQTAEATAEADVQLRADSGHETCFAATAHARGVLSALVDGTHFGNLNLPAEARGELTLAESAQVSEALAVIEECGMGGDEDAEAETEDAQQGPPADVPQGPPADLPQRSPAGAGITAGAASETGVDLEGILDANANAEIGVGVGLGALGRPDGNGRPDGAGQP